MAPGPAPPALPALLALLGALLPGLGGAQTSVDPAEAIIPRGGSVQVNCSTSCNQTSIFGLETLLTKKEIASGDNWMLFELSDVQEDSKLICFSNCHEQTMAPMHLTVYYAAVDKEMFCPLPSHLGTSHGFILKLLTFLSGLGGLGSVCEERRGAGLPEQVQPAPQRPLQQAACPAHTPHPCPLNTQGSPERVELAPLPRWQPVGENLTMTCQVAGGAPRTNLTVVLLRGEEELSRQLAGEPAEVAEVTFTVAVGREDHLANFSCRTDLDLRPRGLGLFQNSSAPRQLRTFVLPETLPRLATPPIVEVGTQWSVDCTLDGVFPASEAQVHLVLAEERLPSTVLYNKESLLAMANVKANPEDEGTQQLWCEVTLGDENRRWQENVTFYSFPAPNLTLSEPEVSEWTTVTVECEAPAGVVVSLSGLPSGLAVPRAQFQLNASAADNRRSFSCSAALEVAGHVLQKNKTRELHVLYGPRLDQRDCLGNWTWEEGSYQTLKCQAWGNPIPELKCHRKGDEALLPIGDLRPVKREVAGTYLCQARSPRGEITREVVINVIYHQNNILIIILVTTIVILGTVSVAAYLYNRQRKIQKYKLQKAQEAAAMKLNTPATPP